MTSPSLPLSSVEHPPSGELPEDRERAIRNLLESIARDTLEEQARRRHRPSMRPRQQLIRTMLATATAGVLVAVSLIAADVFRSELGVAQAATPPLIGHETSAGEPASGELTTLAARVSAGKDGPAGDAGLSGSAATGGGDVTIRTERWSLAVTETASDAGGAAGEGAASEGAAYEGAAGEGAAASGAGETFSSVTTAVIPVRRDVTRHADGSVSIREVGGDPQFPSEAYRRAWTDDGRPGPAGEVLRNETLDAGAWATVYPQDLPARPAQLRDALAVDRPALTEDSGELFRAIHQLHLERLPDAELRAAILQLLADAPDVESLGESTDRAGRTVRAFATDSDSSGWPIRHVLLVDPDDGRVLGYEQVLLDDVERFDASAPAVINYTSFL